MLKTLRKAARQSGKFMAGVKAGLTLNGNYTVELTLNSAAHSGMLSLDRVVALELLDINGKLVSSKGITLEEIAAKDPADEGEIIGRIWRRELWSAHEAVFDHGNRNKLHGQWSYNESLGLRRPAEDTLVIE